VPELVAVAAFASFDNGYAVTHGDGAFTLNDQLTLCDSMARQGDRSVLSMVAEAFRSDGGLGPALASLPVADAADRFVGPGSPWYRDSASQPSPTDPYWQGQNLSAAIDLVNVPVRLISGWQDVFLRETLAQYRRLRERGVEVALTIGPWTHLEMLSTGMGTVLRESLAWVDGHVSGAPTPGARVAYYVTGAGEWRDMSDWPPRTREHRLYLGAGRTLTSEVPPGGAPSVGFDYDPTDPTPTVGGRFLSRRAGYQEDSSLARRGDTATFVTAPLRWPLEVVGAPRLTLAHRCDNADFDLWVRVSEVRPDGRSHNVTEAFRGSPRARDDGSVELELDPCAHRFAAGSRIGLIVGGGSFPRYARNLGTPGNRTEGTELRSSRHAIRLANGASWLSLPEP
jgi:putative CocE/NonD family hydrolase